MPKSSAGNQNLRQAKKAKKDEFYTQLVDIENELKHYKEHFRNKIVYCNCDDPYESNFFKYFAANFKALGLKQLITTSYSGSPIAGTQLPLFEIEGLKPSEPKDAEAYKVIINEVPDFNQDGAISLEDVERLLRIDANVCEPLQGDGDFRSPECVELLKQADIVCTNPPFSLFREYVSQLVEYDKKFLIIGNTNALTYKEIFKLFKEGKISTGYTNFNVGMYFVVPDDWPDFHYVNSEGKKMVRVSTSCWFTNFDIAKRHEELTLYKKYSPEEYPKYDNYDAIEVSRYLDIPMDYEGVMGVPITFLDKYNPEQFEIIDINPHFFSVVEQGLPKPPQLKITGRKDPYARILIKNKKVKK